MVNEIDIKNLIQKSAELMEIIHEPFIIQLLDNKTNKVFKVFSKTTNENNIIAKVGLTGWGMSEFKALKTLWEKKFEVPKPITYIRLHEELNSDWNFGNLYREIGVLFSYALKGQNLKQELTKINIYNALNFLKKLHEDKSLINEIINNYQKIEVERSINYAQKILEGKLANYLEEILNQYQDLEIDYCFIHGGPRLEHFIIQNNQIWMIDFEGACAGDRFKDLGIFFTELFFENGINEVELIRFYFRRELKKEENLRLLFFKLRALLVKMNFEPSENSLKQIKRLVNYS